MPDAILKLLMQFSSAGIALSGCTKSSVRVLLRTLAAQYPRIWQQARRVLEITGLIDVFSVYPSVEQAVSSAKLARPRPTPAL